MKIRIYPQCTHHCTLSDALSSLQNKYMHLVGEANLYSYQIEHLTKLSQNGNLIALRKNDALLNVVWAQGASLEDIRYYEIGRAIVECGKMFLSNKGHGTIELVDWCVYSENRGYGSFFLQSIISCLRMKGYRKIIGEITSADFGHEDKLRHLYGKFGFEIVDRNSKCRDICLKLKPEPKTVADRRDTAQWLTVLQNLQHSAICEKLGMTEQQFERLSLNPLFQEELLQAASDIGEKYVKK